MRHAFDVQQVGSIADQVMADGFCLLCAHFPRAVLAEWNEAFRPLLERHIEREGHLRNRGANRYYVTLPFVAPFADASLFEDPDILAIVERLVGEDFVLQQLATDTPLLGSEYQAFHRDAPPLFPEAGIETPPFQLAVNFPLVSVTPENGPMEITRGTHLMPRDEAIAGIENGSIPVEHLTMEVGDVLIRDVRGVHRGTPNRTAEPRPMVVIGYSRRWLNRPEVSIRIPRSEWDRLSEPGRRMLRYNPRVETIEEALHVDAEVYQSFAY